MDSKPPSRAIAQFYAGGRFNLAFLFDAKLLHGIAIGTGSKLIGFLRDFLVPNLLGVSATADLFVLVMRITLYVRSVVGDNLWIALFVPRLVHHERGSQAQHRAEEQLWLHAARGIFIIEAIALPLRALVLFDCLFWHFVLVRDNLNEVVFLLLASFSFAPLLLGCVLLALLHSRNLVLLANSIAGWSNIVFVFFLVVASLASEDHGRLFLLTFSFIAVAVAQMIAGQRALKFDFRWKKVFAPNFAYAQKPSHIVRILVVAVGLSLQSLPSLMVSLVATRGAEGSITILYLAQRLVMLFPTLVALPMATLMFPELTAVLKQSNFVGARKYVNKGLLQGLVLSLLGCVLTFVAIWPASYLMFFHSARAAAAHALFWNVVICLLPLIPLVFILQILQRFFRARGADWSVLLAGVVGCLATGLVIAWSMHFTQGPTVEALAVALVAGTAATVAHMLILYAMQKAAPEEMRSK